MQLKMTVEVIYEVDEDDYPNPNPRNVAEVEQINLDQSMRDVLELIQDEGYELRVVPTYE